MDGIVSKCYLKYEKEHLAVTSGFMKIYMSDLHELNGLSIAIYSFLQYSYNSMLGFSKFTWQELAKGLNVSLKNSKEYIAECFEQLCDMGYLSYLEYDGNMIYASYFDWDKQIRDQYEFHKDKVKSLSNDSDNKFVKMTYKRLIMFRSLLYNLQRRESVLKTYLAIVSGIYSDGDYCFPCIQTISIKSGVCERTVRTSIDIIKNSHYLYVWNSKYLTKGNKVKQSPNFYSTIEIKPSTVSAFSAELKDFKQWIYDE